MSTPTLLGVLALGTTLMLALAGALWRLGTVIGRIIERIDDLRADMAEHKTDLAVVNDRVTEHRRRNDLATTALREHLDKRLDRLAEGQVKSDALRMLHEHPEEPS